MAQAQIRILVVEIYVVFQIRAVEWVQSKSGTQYGIERCAYLCMNPALGSVVADKERAFLILRGNDGVIGTSPTLVIHDCYARIWQSSVSLTGYGSRQTSSP